MEFLNENILTAIAESNAKDDLVEQNAKVAEEAIAGKIYSSSNYHVFGNSLFTDSIPIQAGKRQKQKCYP